jgi:hypothetical protein
MSFFSSQLQASRGIGGIPLPVLKPPSTSFFNAISGVANVVSAAAPLITASGQVIQGRAAATTLEQQAGILEQEAVTESRLGQFEISQQRKADVAFRGKQLAQIGKSGLVLEGTPLDLIGQTAEEQELGILTMQFNSKQRQRSLRGQAAVKRKQATSQRFAGSVGAASTLLNSNLFRAGTARLGGL